MATTTKLKRRTTALRATDIPGVFINKAGTHVDEHGVALSFKSLRQKDNDRFQEALEGSALGQPADLLRAIALDPRMPLHVRMDAATKAAPYFSPKLMGVQGVAGQPPVGLGLDKLPQRELDALEKALQLAESIINKA